MPKKLNTIIAKAILHQLSNGFEQKEIAEFFKINKYAIGSTRSVELYLQELKRLNDCKTTFMLMYEYGKNPQSIIINQSK